MCFITDQNRFPVTRMYITRINSATFHRINTDCKEKRIVIPIKLIGSRDLQQINYTTAFRIFRKIV